MAGENLGEVHVYYAGLLGDRVYSLIDETNASRFPYLTARQKEELLLFKPRFLKDLDFLSQHPDEYDFSLEVTTPEGRTFKIDDPDFTRFLSERFGKPLHLKFSERGMSDSRPVSIFGLATVRKLAEELGFSLDPLRFRANFYVEWDSGEPFYEDDLVGQSLQVGQKLILKIVKKDLRCKIITLDPQTVQAAPEVLSLVAEKHQNNAGVYAVVEREGTASLHDPLYLV